VYDVTSYLTWLRRRRASLLRASSARAKLHSTNPAASRFNRAENQLPPFKFGDLPSLPTPMLMSSDECFVPSPPKEKKIFPSNPQPHYGLGPPRLKQPFSSVTGHLRSTGSPNIGHVRKPSIPGQRPRKHMRRSLSMFEHPEEILKHEKATLCNAEALGSIMDVDDIPPLKLPHFKPDEESLPRITKETMVDILDGKYGLCYDRSIIVDCRFEYEFKGGHIDGAINVNNKEELATQLFETAPAERALLVFHCEYSAHRAPLMYAIARISNCALLISAKGEISPPQRSCSKLSSISVTIIPRSIYSRWRLQFILYGS
jgi:M-phase inducer tyrosine phosphatase